MHGEPEDRSATKPDLPSSADEPDATDRWNPPPSTVERLRPWLDLDRVGPAEFYRWLEIVAPLLPPVGAAPARSHDLEGRISELAHALVESAQAEARAHFQAAEYFQENAALARRTRALEAMIRTAGLPVPPGSRAIDRAAERYLPRSSER